MQFSGQSGRYLRQSEVMNFKDSTDKKTVIDRINNMRQMSGDTCIGEALDYFYRSFFISREDRPPTFSQTDALDRLLWRFLTFEFPSNIGQKVTVLSITSRSSTFSVPSTFGRMSIFGIVHFPYHTIVRKGTHGKAGRLSFSKVGKMDGLRSGRASINGFDLNIF